MLLIDVPITPLNYPILKCLADEYYAEPLRRNETSFNYSWNPGTNSHSDVANADAMSDAIQLVVFRLAEQRYALPLAAVERIVWAAEVTPLPKAPRIVLGVIDVAGQVLPVLNVRPRFRLPEHEISPADQFLIVRTAQRTVVLVIDEAQGVIERPSTDIVASAQIVPGLEQIQGVVKTQRWPGVDPQPGKTSLLGRSAGPGRSDGSGGGTWDLAR